VEWTAPVVLGPEWAGPRLTGARLKVVPPASAGTRFSVMMGSACW
jgi:hypothetical protein